MSSADAEHPRAIIRRMLELCVAINATAAAARAGLDGNEPHVAADVAIHVSDAAPSLPDTAGARGPSSKPSVGQVNEGCTNATVSGSSPAARAVTVVPSLPRLREVLAEAQLRRLQGDVVEALQSDEWLRRSSESLSKLVSSADKVAEGDMENLLAVEAEVRRRDAADGADAVSARVVVLRPSLSGRMSSARMGNRQRELRSPSNDTPAPIVVTIDRVNVNC